jgi:hypothetical protein
VRLAAHQPQYLPWLGYFDKMDRADLFVLIDTVQYKKNEWQNRNRIRTAAGWQWLTVPVHHRFPMRIDQVRVDERSGWRRRHVESLRQAYARAPHRDGILPAIEALLAQPYDGLAGLNTASVRLLAGLLGIATPIRVSSSIDGVADGPDERLIDLCVRHGCDTYLAGQGGRDYMDLERWRRAGIRVEFQEFDHPVYPQCHAGFVPGLSAVDLLMQRGPGASAGPRAVREAAA